MPSAHLAIDLGASSGRAVLGLLGEAPKRLEIEEVHRFEHRPIDTPAGPVWDFTGIVNEVLSGLRRGASAAVEAGVALSSVGVDSWGVDWSVVTNGGGVVGLPRCYRDAANAAAKVRVPSTSTATCVSWSPRTCGSRPIGPRRKDATPASLRRK